MVVGDDQIEAEFPGARGGLDAPDPAVHRDAQLDAIGVQSIDGGRLQSIAVAKTLGPAG